MAHYADLEQFSGLCLHTLGTVDYHDCRICCHQCTVSILREILMSRCIQNINAVTIIMKLQNRGSNGNTSLFFDLHPV